MDAEVNMVETITNKTEVEKEIDDLNRRALELVYIDSEQSLSLSQKALELSKGVNYESGIARSILSIGGYHNATGQYEESIKYAKEALDKFILLDDKYGQMRTYYSLGRAYNGLEQFASAIENNSKSLELSIQLNDKNVQASAYNGLGFTYDYLGEKNQALEYFLKGLELNQNDPYILNNIGCIYSNIGKHEEAVDYTKKILAILDIYEALTSPDRPYKLAKSSEEALKILQYEVDAGHLDRDIFEIFVEQKIYMSE